MANPTIGTPVSTASSASITAPHTPSASDNYVQARIMFVTSNGDTISSVTYNGTAMTLVGTMLTGNSWGVARYGLAITPGGGTQNIVVAHNAAAGVNPYIIIPISYTLANSAAPITDAAIQRSQFITDAPNYHDTITSATGHLVVVSVGLEGATTAAGYNGTTILASAIYNTTPFTGTSSAYFAVGTQPGAATTDAGVTESGGPFSNVVAMEGYTLGSGGGGRTFFLPSGLDGHSTSGPKQFNPALT
jgi:hypothetical protein